MGLIEYNNTVANGAIFILYLNLIKKINKSKNNLARKNCERTNFFRGKFVISTIRIKRIYKFMLGKKTKKKIQKKI